MPTYLYERKLLNDPAITKKLADIYYGYSEPQSVSLEFSNTDGYFTNLIATEEIRNRNVQIRRHEPLEGVSFEISGIITDFSINNNDVFSVTVSINNPDPLQTEIGRKLLETNDWSWGTNPTALIYLPSQDLGSSYPLCFGYCRKVPLIYVKANHTSGQKAFDYIVSYGQIVSVVTVYRNKKVINMAAEGVTVHTGDSSSPYFLTLNGQTVYFAYIRFPLEQRDFSNNMYELTADVRGMRLGTGNMQKNFASVCKEILNNQAWGCGMAVNDASFTSAATQSAIDFPECLDYISNLDGGCSGNISTHVKAYDLVNEILIACRGRLETNSNNEQVLIIDKYTPTASATFGQNDGYYNNCDFLSISKIPTTEAIKNIKIEYGYDNWSGKFAHTNTRNCRTFGEDKTFSFGLVRDHITVDRISSYLKNIELHDTRIVLKAGMEARHLQYSDVVRLINQRWSIDNQYHIRGIERSLSEFVMTLADYNPSIYAYTAGTMPVDPYNDIADDVPDYSFTTPDTPTGLAIDTTFGTNGWRIRTATDGKVSASVRLKANAPTVNFASMSFGERLAEDSLYYTWTAGQHVSGVEWRGVIRGLIAGQSYVFAARCVNKFGILSNIASITAVIAPGDTTAPGQVVGLTARCKLKTWEFQWTANTDTDLSGYRVQINSNSAFNGTMYYNAKVDSAKLSYTNDALPHPTTLFCRVRAIDYTGNESTLWSATASAITTKINTPDVDDGGITTPKRQPCNSTSVYIDNLPLNERRTVQIQHNLSYIPVGMVACSNFEFSANIWAITETILYINVINNSDGRFLDTTITFFYW